MMAGLDMAEAGMVRGPPLTIRIKKSTTNNCLSRGTAAKYQILLGNGMVDIQEPLTHSTVRPACASAALGTRH